MWLVLLAQFQTWNRIIGKAWALWPIAIRSVIRALSAAWTMFWLGLMASERLRWIIQDKSCAIWSLLKRQSLATVLNLQSMYACKTLPGPRWLKRWKSLISSAMNSAIPAVWSSRWIRIPVKFWLWCPIRLTKITGWRASFLRIITSN